MLYSLGREDKSIVEWAEKISPLIAEAEHFPAKNLGTFISLWSKSVSYIGESELYARQAERREIFEVDDLGAKYYWNLFEERNKIGIKGLEQTRQILGVLSGEFKLIDEEMKNEGRDINSQLEYFRSSFYQSLANLEMKKSDALELKEMVEKTSALVRNNGLTSLVQLMDEKIVQGIELRQQTGRGAETNIAPWKIAAVVIILIALGVIFAIHCGLFGCGVQIREGYFVAMTAISLLWWC